MLDKQEFKHHLMCNPDFSLSAGSVKTYVSNVEMFFRRYPEFTQENVDDYYFSIRETKTPNYINVMLNSLDRYMQFKQLNIKIPKKIKRVKDDTKEVITYDYLINGIFDAIDYGDFQNKHQVKAILIFMFYTAMRLSDYMQLHRSDFTFEENYGYVYVYIRKNKLKKKLIFPKEVSKHLTYYFDITMEQDNALNLTPTTIRNLFHRLNELIPERHFHPHMMRGSAITHLYTELKMPLEEIAMLLGVSAPTIQQYYLNIKREDTETSYINKLKGGKK